MRILYIAKHDSGGNDDEGAITHALTQLGHDVQRIRETRGRLAIRLKADCVLFHKWSDFDAIKTLSEKLPCFFWYFDLVEYPDPFLRSRNMTRVAWMNCVMPHITLGFCTDGDWVTKHPKKLRILRQGADERVIGTGIPSVKPRDMVLFTGIKFGGSGRHSFVRDMERYWPNEFDHVEKGIYSRDLANRIAEDKVVICPPHPVTNLYWSNRVYLSAGFGACLIHPRCEKIVEEYEDGKEILYYETEREMYSLINTTLHNLTWKETRAIGERAFDRTVAQHLYYHRCQELVRQIEEVLP